MDHWVPGIETRFDYIRADRIYRVEYNQQWIFPFRNPTAKQQATAKVKRIRQLNVWRFFFIFVFAEINISGGFKFRASARKVSSQTKLTKSKFCTRAEKCIKLVIEFQSLYTTAKESFHCKKLKYNRGLRET